MAWLRIKFRDVFYETSAARQISYKFSMKGTGVEISMQDHSVLRIWMNSMYEYEFNVRIITKSRKFDHITPLLNELHWIPVKL